MNPVVEVVVDNGFVEKVTKEKVDEKLSDMGVGTWWSMKRLEYETSRGYDWIRENILYDPRLHKPGKEIAKQMGTRWMFKGPEMREFLNKYFNEI